MVMTPRPQKPAASTTQRAPPWTTSLLWPMVTSALPAAKTASPKPAMRGEKALPVAWTISPKAIASSPIQIAKAATRATGANMVERPRLRPRSRFHTGSSTRTRRRATWSVVRLLPGTTTVSNTSRSVIAARAMPAASSRKVQPIRAQRAGVDLDQWCGRRAASAAGEGQAEGRSDLQHRDQLEVGGEWRLASLVAEHVPGEEGGGPTAGCGEAQQILFADPPRAGPRPLLVLPEGEEGPQVDADQRREDPGDVWGHGRDIRR